MGARALIEAKCVKTRSLRVVNDEFFDDFGCLDRVHQEYCMLLVMSTTESRCAEEDCTYPLRFIDGDAGWDSYTDII